MISSKRVLSLDICRVQLRGTSQLFRSRRRFKFTSDVPPAQRSAIYLRRAEAKRALWTSARLVLCLNDKIPSLPICTASAWGRRFVSFTLKVLLHNNRTVRFETLVER